MVFNDFGAATVPQQVSAGGGADAEAPTVSVVIPAFNAAQTVARALKSVRDQDLAGIVEIVLVDDASQDDTSAVALRTGAPNLRILTLRENVGAGAARNAGLAIARGEFVAFLDADDEWLPTKLSRQISEFEQNPDCRLVTCDCLLVQMDSGTVRFNEVVPPDTGPEAWKSLLARNFCPTPTVMVRRVDAVAVGGFRPELPIGEDLDLWIRVAEHGEIAHVPEVLVRVYERPGSLMRTHHSGELDFVLPMIQGHVERLADRLSRRERWQLEAEPHFRVGYQLLTAGREREAVNPLLFAFLRGYRVTRSMPHLLVAVWRCLTAPKT